MPALIMWGVAAVAAIVFARLLPNLFYATLLASAVAGILISLGGLVGMIDVSTDTAAEFITVACQCFALSLPVSAIVVWVPTIIGWGFVRVPTTEQPPRLPPHPIFTKMSTTPRQLGLIGSIILAIAFLVGIGVCLYTSDRGLFRATIGPVVLAPFLLFVFPQYGLGCILLGALILSGFLEGRYRWISLSGFLIAAFSWVSFVEWLCTSDPFD